MLENSEATEKVMVAGRVLPRGCRLVLIRKVIVALGSCNLGNLENEELEQG